MMFNANNILLYIHNIYIYYTDVVQLFFILVLWCSLLGALGLDMCVCAKRQLAVRGIIDL